MVVERPPPCFLPVTLAAASFVAVFAVAAGRDATATVVVGAGREAAARSPRRDAPGPTLRLWNAVNSAARDA